MKTLWSLCLCWALLLLGSTSIAQSPELPLSQLLTPAQQLAGRFEQYKYLSILPNPLRSSGRFSYSSAGGLHWLTEQPLASEVIISQQGIRQLHQGQVVWESESAQSDNVAQLMAAILSGDVAQLQQDFNVDDFQPAKADGQWHLYLSPKSDLLRSFFSRIQIQGRAAVEALMLHSPNGDRTEITLQLETLEPSNAH